MVFRNPLFLFSDHSLFFIRLSVAQSEDRGRISTATPGSPSRSTEREGQGLGEFRGNLHLTLRKEKKRMVFNVSNHHNSSAFFF